MKSWKRTIGVALSVTVAFASVAHAELAPASEYARGEVRKVDKENRKVTIRHGDIPALDMPPMTMVFIARDASLLERLKPGDKVSFRAASESGTLYITDVKANP
jgi:Cu/Ag efflux protein CusF